MLDIKSYLSVTLVISFFFKKNKLVFVKNSNSFFNLIESRANVFSIKISFIGKIMLKFFFFSLKLYVEKTIKKKLTRKIYFF